jgi:hypothetical protein
MWAYHIDDFGEKQVSGILILQVLLFYCSDIILLIFIYKLLLINCGAVIRCRAT